MKDALTQLFYPAPERWRLRGCEFLWSDLKVASEGWNSTLLPAELRKQLEKSIREILGEPLRPNGTTYVERYAQGGMSSGQVDHSYWLNEAIPLLTGRLRALHRRQFLEREFAAMSIVAGFATRDRLSPVYRAADTQARDSTKAFVRQLLFAIGRRYSMAVPDEEQHVLEILGFARAVADARGDCLHQGVLRFGVAQKVVNLYLKYLWLADLCAEPPHCPIDGIVRDRAGLHFSWTRSDDVSQYLVAIADLRQIAGSDTLAAWELSEFQRSR